MVGCDATGCCDEAKGYTLPPGTLELPTPRISRFGLSGMSPENLSLEGGMDGLPGIVIMVSRFVSIGESGSCMGGGATRVGVSPCSITQPTGAASDTFLTRRIGRKKSLERTLK